MKIKSNDQFKSLAAKAGVTPEEILNIFIADLTGIEGNHGQNQRSAARDYFLNSRFMKSYEQIEDLKCFISYGFTEDY